MTYQIKPLSCDPARLKGLSEKLIVSHYENNYGGAVKRLNAITEQLAGLDISRAPVFTINGLKREELIATNSMILHELYFDGLGDSQSPPGVLRDALMRDFVSIERWQAEFSAMGKAQGGGSGWVLLVRSTCMNIRTILIMARKRLHMSMLSCRISTGNMLLVSTRSVCREPNHIA